MEETIMRKWFIILLTMLLAFTACRQEMVLPSEGDVVNGTNICLNLNLQHPDVATKGIKSGWENGDKVFIFLSDCTTGCFTTTYNGTGWSTGIVGVVTIGSTKILHAVYLPYGNDATPTFSQNKWTFNKATDTYYFYASNVPYTVETVGTEQVITATVQMVKPSTYVQFYVPLASATGTVQFACNALCPAGLASLSSDGTVTENIGTAGQPVTGYADTLEGEEGYYVSGIPVDNPGTDYYFVLKKGDTYSHFYKNRSAIQTNKAYQLASYTSWPVVGSSQYVMMEGLRWETVNKGADIPWELGTPYATYTPSYLSERLPEDAEWNALMTNAEWKNISILGVQGSLVVSNSNYIFLPRSSSATSYYWSEGFLSSLQIGTDGSHSLISSGLPAEAYVRTVIKRNWFRIIAEANGKITATTNTGVLKYSRDGGQTWSNYPSGGINVTTGEEICFKASTNDWKTGSSKKLYSSGKFRIAGDIASLLAGDSFDTGGAQNLNNYTFVNFLTNCKELTDASELVLSIPTAPSSSYKSFFEGCSNMVAGPKELSATNINATCYRNMFNGCTSLTSAPIIRNPSVHNGTGWYQRMFYNCSNLTEIVFLDNAPYNRRTFNDYDNKSVSFRGGWVSGVAPTGTIYVNNAETDNPFAGKDPGEDTFPSGWTIATYTP